MQPSPAKLNRAVVVGTAGTEMEPRNLLLEKPFEN